MLDEEGNLLGYRGADTDITGRKRAEEALKKRDKELEEQYDNLTEVNSALRVLLRQRENDKDEFENNIVSNMKHLVFPHLETLKKTRLSEEQKTLIGILESNLNNLMSPFASKLSSEYLSLSPKEIRVADLVKAGITNKEMAELLCLSKNTILFHRYNLRTKLGLKNKKINLRSYLRAL
jgi:DNA-binding CsgD family transcriptional regulator